MSKANSARKVLKTALRRVQTRWGQNAWSKEGPDGRYYVCMEGALFGGCQIPQTAAQVEAHNILLEVIKEDLKAGNGEHIIEAITDECIPDEWGREKLIKRLNIPTVNDRSVVTQEDVERWMKLALIRAETGGLLEEDPDFTDEEVDELLDKELLAEQ